MITNQPSPEGHSHAMNIPNIDLGATSPVDSEFIDLLAEAVARVVPNVTVAQATLRMEEVGHTMSRRELYDAAPGIVAGG